MNKTINKSILALLACSAAFCACSREEADLFDKSAADRLNEVSDLYSARLADKGGEWIMEYYPTNEVDSATSAYAHQSRGYLMLNKFNPDGSVLVGMSNEFSGNEYMEDLSAWEVITDLGPVLSYNSYNTCMHTFSNPQEFSFNGWTGENGMGVAGDYEFVITNLDENASTAMLKGKKRGSYDLLTRLPEGTDFKAYFEDVNGFCDVNFPADIPNDIVMEFNGKKFYVRDLATKIATIWPYEGTWADDKSYHPFLVSKKGDDYVLRFREAFESGDAMLQELVWHEDMFSFVDAENSANLIRPLENADLGNFFSESLGKKGWVINDKTVASEDGAALIARVYAGFPKKTSSNTLQTIQIGKSEKQMLLNFTFKQGRSKTANYRYLFDCAATDNGVELKYDKAFDPSSEKNLDIDGMSDFINMLNGSIVVSDPETTGFVINRVKMNCPNGMWFMLNYAK